MIFQPNRSPAPVNHSIDSVIQNVDEKEDIPVVDIAGEATEPEGLVELAESIELAEAAEPAELAESKVAGAVSIEAEVYLSSEEVGAVEFTLLFLFTLTSGKIVVSCSCLVSFKVGTDESEARFCSCNGLNSVLIKLPSGETGMTSRNSTMSQI